MRLTKRTERILGLLWLLLCLGLALYYLIFCRSAYLDSDMSSELILAKLLSEEGGILSKNWYYSTELRVLNTQLIFAPLFLIFDNWHTVRVVGTVILWGILLGSYAYMLHGLGLDRWFCLTAGFLLLPFSHDYFLVVLLGSYYIPHITISQLTLGILFRLTGHRKPQLLLAAAVLLAFLAGVGGMRQPVVLYLPLCGAAFFLLLLRREKTELRLFFAALILLLFSLLGYGCNSLLAQHYHFTQYDDLSLGFRPDGFLKLWHGLLGCFGYNDIGREPLRMVLAVLAAFSLILLLLSLLRRHTTLSRNDLLLCLFLLMGFLVLCGIYCGSNMDYSIRYFLPIFIFILPVSALCFSHSIGRTPSAILLTLLLLSGLGGYPGYFRWERSAKQSEIADILQQEQCLNGVASFWNANVLTEYSNGNLEVWSFLNTPSNVYKWLQTIKHCETKPSGRCFLLLEDGETPHPAVEAKYRLDDLSLYIFEDHRDLQNTLCAWHESFEGESGGLINGFDSNGKRQLDPGGISFGPYITLWPGLYQMTAVGANLQDAGFDIQSAQGPLSFILEEQSPECIRCSFRVDETAEELELRFFNLSNTTLTLDDITLTCQEPF